MDVHDIEVALGQPGPDPRSRPWTEGDPGDRPVVGNAHSVPGARDVGRHRCTAVFPLIVGTGSSHAVVDRGEDRDLVTASQQGFGEIANVVLHSARRTE
ncbi:hypothetical protein GCM10009744_43610 [Kribbella alba]|uniref:Uncharacterized protein n=1 Tax=Kribbella alba TaxID=190197 RepID=A0ABN2FJ31_9ACTN